jgi:hypothetical protein
MAGISDDAIIEQLKALRNVTQSFRMEVQNEFQI